MKIELANNWKFCLGDVKRWERVDHHIYTDSSAAEYSMFSKSRYNKLNNFYL